MVAVAGSLGIAVAPLDPTPPPPGAVIVDALLGTGGSGAPRGELGRAVEWLAGIDAPVVALDIPSGVDADTGRVAGAAVDAELTITYHGDMPGLRVAPGAAHAGEVVVADIGIPSAVSVPARAWRADTGVIGAIPAKGASGDKYAAGAALVVAGAPGLTGAACLAARATLRAGGGLTVVAAPAAVQPLIAAQLVEIMCAAVPDDAGALAPVSLDEIVRQAGRVAAIALGPGIGRAAATTRAVEAILAAVDLPAVVDADGLWHLAELGALRAERGAPTVITPHTGEAARLLGVERAQVEAGRIDAATELAARHGAIVVLKGPGTLVAAPDGRLVINGTGSSALATAGSGDVLTGVLVAHLAKGMEPFAAAVTAVAVHGRAGDLAGRGDGTIASDVIEALPRARATTAA
jgi:ADP-dependent NAD(P)H-hydrate dehydratase / NAD(P)H-hydrate epimerase